MHHLISAVDTYTDLESFITNSHTIADILVYVAFYLLHIL